MTRTPEQAALLRAWVEPATLVLDDLFRARRIGGATTVTTILEPKAVAAWSEVSGADSGRSRVRQCGNPCLKRLDGLRARKEIALKCVATSLDQEVELFAGLDQPAVGAEHVHPVAGIAQQVHSPWMLKEVVHGCEQFPRQGAGLCEICREAPGVRRRGLVPRRITTRMTSSAVCRCRTGVSEIPRADADGRASTCAGSTRTAGPIAIRTPIGA